MIRVSPGILSHYFNEWLAADCIVAGEVFTAASNCSCTPEISSKRRFNFTESFVRIFSDAGVSFQAVRHSTTLKDKWIF